MASIGAPASIRETIQWKIVHLNDVVEPAGGHVGPVSLVKCRPNAR